MTAMAERRGVTATPTVLVQGAPVQATAQHIVAAVAALT